MPEFLVLVRKELLEQWRTKKILIMAIIFLFVAISSPIIAKLTPELLKSVSIPGLSINLPAPTYNDALDQLVKNISQIALLILVFMVAGAVSDEKSKKTLDIVLTKPISRTKFILSKFCSYFVIISLIFISACLVFYIYTITNFATFNLINFLLMMFIMLLYVLMIISITIFASTMVSNSLVAGGIGFASFIIFGTISGLIEPIKKYSPNLIFSDYKELVASGLNTNLLISAIIIIGVITVFIVSSIVAFRHQEIKN